MLDWRFRPVAVTQVDRIERPIVGHCSRRILSRRSPLYGLEQLLIWNSRWTTAFQSCERVLSTPSGHEDILWLEVGMVRKSSIH